MKKILLSALCLISLQCSAGDVRISARSTLGALNHYSSWVYFTVTVSSPSDESNCHPETISSIIALAPGASISFSDNNLPPGIASLENGKHYYFISASVLNGPIACASAAMEVGELCAGLNQSVSTMMKQSDCTSDRIVSATWTVDTDNPTLIFE